MKIIIIIKPASSGRALCTGSASEWFALPEVLKNASNKCCFCRYHLQLFKSYFCTNSNLGWSLFARLSELVALKCLVI